MSLEEINGRAYLAYEENKLAIKRLEEKKELFSRNLVCWFGAGFSANFGFPLYSELREITGDLRNISNTAKKYLINRYINKSIFEQTPHSILHNIAGDVFELIELALQQGVVVTTNYDQVIADLHYSSQLFKNTTSDGDTDRLLPALRTTYDGCEYVLNRSDDFAKIIHIHGMSVAPVTCVLNGKDYEDLFSEECYLNAIKHFCIDRIPMFIGCSVGSGEPFKQVLEESKSFGCDIRYIYFEYFDSREQGAKSSELLLSEDNVALRISLNINEHLYLSEIKVSNFILNQDFLGLEKFIAPREIDESLLLKDQILFDITFGDNKAGALRGRNVSYLANQSLNMYEGRKVIFVGSEYLGAYLSKVLRFYADRYDEVGFYHHDISEVSSFENIEDALDSISSRVEFSVTETHSCIVLSGFCGRKVKDINEFNKILDERFSYCNIVFTGNNKDTITKLSKYVRSAKPGKRKVIVAHPCLNNSIFKSRMQALWESESLNVWEGALDSIPQSVEQMMKHHEARDKVMLDRSAIVFANKMYEYLVGTDCGNPLADCGERIRIPKQAWIVLAWRICSVLEREILSKDVSMPEIMVSIQAVFENVENKIHRYEMAFLFEFLSVFAGGRGYQKSVFELMSSLLYQEYGRGANKSVKAVQKIAAVLLDYDEFRGGTLYKDDFLLKIRAGLLTYTTDDEEFDEKSPARSLAPPFVRIIDDASFEIIIEDLITRSDHGMLRFLFNHLYACAFNKMQEKELFGALKVVSESVNLNERETKYYNQLIDRFYDCGIN